MIITLCGSGRFEPWFHLWNEALSLAGHTVFGLGSYPSQHAGEEFWPTPEQRQVLDEVQLEKIKVSDVVLVLNVFAYLSESTLREIDVATQLKKDVRFLESWGAGCGIGRKHTDSYREAAATYGVPCGYGSPIHTCNYKDVWYGDLLSHGGSARSSICQRIYAHTAVAMLRRPHTGAV